MAKPQKALSPNRQSIDKFKKSLHSCFEQANAIAESGNLASAYMTAHVLADGLGAINQASGTNPDVGQKGELYQALLNEIQQLLNRQNQAAHSRTQCWQAFVDALSGPRDWLRSHKQSGDPITQEEYKQFQLDIAHAFESFERCMTLPRPKVVV